MRLDFRKTYFLLPNLFTLACLFCGFYAITLCGRLGAEGTGEDVLYKAALAILLGLFFDATDGRIARLTKTQSELGLNLDSLADVVTFGAAPALLVYRWGLEDLGRVGMFFAFLFVACGALRLARFNVLSLRGSGQAAGKYMLGLPIPIAAQVIVALVLVNNAIGVHRAVNQVSIAILVGVLGYLMISGVRFRSMKDLKLNKRTLGFGFVLLVLGVIVAARIHAPAVFMLLIGLYIALGLTEEVLFFRRRRAEERASARAQMPADDEREVLAELGASESMDRSLEEDSGPIPPSPELASGPSP